MSNTVDIPQELKDSLRKFRFSKKSKGSCALVVKVNKQKLILEEVEQFEDVSLDELGEELPSQSPRFVVLSYELKHNDGRVSYPLVVINWTPTGCETGLMTLHASATILFQNVADVQRVLEVRDGAEGLTKEILEAKLK